MPLPDLVRSHRKALGLSQKALGELAGTSQQHIQRIEAGRKNIRVETIIKLERALKLKRGALLQ